MNPSLEARAAQRCWGTAPPRPLAWVSLLVWGVLQSSRCLEGGLGRCADPCFNHHLPLAGVPCQEPRGDPVSPHQDEVVLPFAAAWSPASHGSFACDRPVNMRAPSPRPQPGEPPSSRTPVTHALAPPGSAV